MEAVWGLFLIILFIVFYFLPGLVAEHRGRDGVFVIGLANLLLGWTVIGWFVLLIIAFTGENSKAKAARDEELALLRRIAAQKQD